KCSHGNPDPTLPLTKGHPIYGRKQETSQRKPEKQNVFTVTFSMNKMPTLQKNVSSLK
uniref:Uncharacterized protein n=1 Tax=Bubo bubo TaxID=30461 RepID=A0A8C0EUS5_BUBBB